MLPHHNIAQAWDWLVHRDYRMPCEQVKISNQVNRSFTYQIPLLLEKRVGEK